MSKSLTQLSLSEAIAVRAEERRRQKQDNCKHDFIIVPYFDFEHDEVYYSAICKNCNYAEN